MRFFNFFKGLRGKLTLTYTLVTVSAILALEVIVFLLFFAIAIFMRTNDRQYFSDVIDTLYPQARPFFLEDPTDVNGLQNWLDQTYQSGYASLEPQNTMDSPAAPIASESPLYVLSLDRTILAQSSSEPVDLTGRTFTASSDAYERILQSAFAGNRAVSSLMTATSGGNYQLAVPIWTKDRDDVLGVILVTVQPPPSLYFNIFPTFLAVFLMTAFFLLVAVAPFGILFGFIMSRGLTRRIGRLSQATESWRKADFSLLPEDKSRDELGQLSVRFREMAEEINQLMRTRQLLASMQERNRLARDLHDTVKQQIFATMMQVRAARNLIHQNPQMAEQRLYEAEKLIRASQQELGLMIAELRPTTLQEKGLVQALKEFLQTWQDSCQIRVDFAVEQERSVDAMLEQTVYRVVQEALSNVLKHSQASEVRIQLVFSKALLTLMIRDNGFGFEQQETSPSGFGLVSMRQRVIELKGKFQVQSTVGEGTRIWVEIPIEEE